MQNHEPEHEIESPIRAEIFSAERLEEYAAYLATELKVSDGEKRGLPLLPRMRENGKKLLEYYRTLAEAIHQKEAISPGAEWLVDNFHIVEEQLREIHHDLPAKFYHELPKLALGELAGFPRIYALALALVAHTDSRLEAEAIRRFLLSFQKMNPLGIGELWALSITLRLVLVENLRRISSNILSERKKRNQADLLADQIIEHGGGDEKFKYLASQIPVYCSQSIQNEYAFIAQLIKRFRDMEAEHWPAVESLEKHLAAMNSSMEQVVHMDHQVQAANQISVANIITSMRLLSSLDWQDFFESVSLVDRILERDPEGSYLQMDFSTRDQYRHVVEGVAKKTKRSELDVASDVVRLAKQAKTEFPNDPRRSHVGYYLTVGSALLRYPKTIYFGLTGFLFAIFCAGVLYYSALQGVSADLLIAVAVLTLLPASDLALNLANFILTNSIVPRRLPKLDFSLGIPVRGRTMVVIPCMLSSLNEIAELLGKLEIHYLGNSDPQLFFALLADCLDSDHEAQPDDERFLNAANAGISKLNRKYAGRSDSETGTDTFFLFHRKRRWNTAENIWMGWERKRGKLHEFNRILRGAENTSFESIPAELDFLRSIRFVLTLDADTQLPRDSAHKMIGTILHPLNQARFDSSLGRVTEGYGVLQPRISISLESSAKSNFAKIFSGHIGIDPYTTAVSDVYQDLFCEGSYTGKGLYDVDAFEAALKGRVPENMILSHDLFEGLYARTGLLTDVELIDDYPQSYDGFFKRQHRWIRGDWQIARWLLPFVPDSTGQSVRNRLPFVGRWKIFDNLRRSLVAPAMLLWFFLGWWALPGSPLFWVATGLCITVFSCFTYVIGGIITVRRRSRRTSFSTKWSELRTILSQAVLSMIFLAHQAFVSVDAIVRFVYRSFVSKRNLLEWATAAQVETQSRRKRSPFWQQRWPTEIMLSLVGIFIWISILPVSLASAIVAGAFVVMWMSYPLVGSVLSRKITRRQSVLDGRDRQLLRLIARRTWNYFDTFVGEEDNFLPPDNYQEDPKPKVAHRTSPTNIGVYLLSLAAARDFGYLSSTGFLRSLRATLTSMQKLEQFQGHFFNWYDTTNLQPLHPKYISTVDSGNLIGYLLTAKQVCFEIQRGLVLDKSLIDGLEDTLSVLEEEFIKTRKNEVVLAEILRCKQLLASAQVDCFSDWSKLLNPLLLSFQGIRKIITDVEPRDESSEEVTKWADLCVRRVQSALEDLNGFAPWTDQRLSAGGDRELSDLFLTLDRATTYRALSRAFDDANPLIDRMTGSSAPVADALRSAKQKLVRFFDEAKGTAQVLNEMFEKMNFAFLLDEERGVFSIGYNVADGKRDNSVYDLLASESRLASFVAIAKGEVPQKHWFRLGRQLVPTREGRALISWTASMFEYLMPLLVMRNYESTLLDETCHTVVMRQMSYGKEHHVPWGISEAGYNARDLQFNYQYGPFGIPGLGLKRGLSHDLVISPYSTLLAAMVDPNATIENLKHLISLKILTVFGFYEAIDYTAERHPVSQKFSVIRSFMAHHQGMSLVAIDNVLHDGVMQSRFHREPCIRATRLLLQERIPTGVIPILPKAAEVELETEHRFDNNQSVRQYKTPDISSPRVQILSNGDYSLMVTTGGGGYSKCGSRAVSRWREDPTRDHMGSFIYIKDVSAARIWSATYQPTTQAFPESYVVTFGDDKIEFSRRDGDISSHTEIIVATEDNVEIRYVSLTNHSTEPRVLELTSYLEPVLGPAANDLDHPAFNKLFIETEFLASSDTLLAKRRKRSSTEKDIWGLHVVASDTIFSSRVQCETDRARFLGRGRTTKNPLAIFDGVELSGTVGATLDPILSLRVQVELRPQETCRVAFTTGLAVSREQALEVSDRYRDIQSYDRESKLAWTKSQVDLRHLGIDSEDAYLFQRLAEKVLYSDPILRPPSHQLTKNANTQSNLWRYGISGDLPIVAVTISEMKDMPVVRKLLRCHEYLRLKGLEYDFVILNEHGPTYFQGLQDELQQQIRTTGSQAWFNKPGGIFILRSDVTAKAHRDHIQAVSRISLFADRPLREQIARKVPAEKYPAPLVPTVSSESKEEEIQTSELLVPKLSFFNEFGGFSEDGREYVIILKDDQWTPAPWINVVGNAHDFGFQISETGAGFTWSINSQVNRLTPWSNDPVSDPSGEVIYLRDEDTGEIWTPTPLPIREKSPYVIKHGQGFTSFEHVSHGFRSKLTVFVPVGDSIKLSILELTNLTDRNRKLSITSYTEWVLGSQKQKSSPHLVCDVDAESGAIFAQNPMDNEFSNRVAFADISETERAFTCSRREFFGRNGNFEKPAALKRQSLSGKKGTGQDPCAAIQTIVEFQAHETHETTLLLGECENAESARKLTLRYRDRQVVNSALREVTENWSQLLNAVQVKTPEPSIDIMMNGWLLYQSLSCRFWSRTAFYQSGGAYGFRDQLQDCMSFVYSAPKLTRDHILRASGRQFREGDVQHWWHPPSGRGIRTRMTDDLLWLPFVVSFYIRVTGDQSILTESVPFLEAPLLHPEQEDSYTTPQVSSEAGSVFEHCLRAIDRSLSLGQHGLPLIGTGDWNDGMSRVGVEGKGESVWLGWFLSKVIQDFLPFCAGAEQISRRATYQAHIEKLKQALEEHGWDGEWYRRAYFDDGTPLGSAANQECRIDSIAQTWSILSEVGDPKRSILALEKMREFLVRKDSKIILLLSPPFDKCEEDPGYIKGYVPGVRENGGQYTHAAAWAVMAHAKLGDGETAMELFEMLNPLNHARTRAEAETYKIEPYVLAGDVYSVDLLEGRGGWSWYTGAAPWYYRAGLESILGFRLRDGKLSFEPCIPKSWREYEVNYKFGKSIFKTKIENPNGLSSGATVVHLDGVLQPSSEVVLVDDGKDHSISVILEPG